MRLKIKNVPSFPFDSIRRLESFELSLSNEIKQLLNTAFNHIRVELSISLVENLGRPLVIIENSSTLLKNSIELIDCIRSFLSTKEDDIKNLVGVYTLEISIKMSEVRNKNSIASRGENQDAPVFVPIEPRYNFDQMILSDSIKDELYNAIKIIEYKDLIYKEWGFEDVDPIPRCILNFYGEPGTGKTMCAHAVAKRLGKKILALNYSEIESKYVGEAAKNLQLAFKAGSDYDAVLFFDEADSFLGKRIENVSQGADQALNSLRSQMLILLESFSGVVLFATNLVTNFDHAFESRILKHIHFELPNEEARASIIKKMLPPRVPLQSKFTDSQFLAASSLIDGFSGREIKTAIFELLLSKAGIDNPEISFNDVCEILKKKKEEKKELKKQEEYRLKEKIAKKLKEKAEENKALKDMGEDKIDDGIKDDSVDKHDAVQLRVE